MANKYVYCVWDVTEDRPINSQEYASIFQAEENMWFQIKYGIWAGEHDFDIRRRLVVPAWEKCGG